jgi:hypothetical protein
MRKSTILGLQKTLSNRLKRRSFPQVLFMMIMNLTLGRAKKRRTRRTRGAAGGAVYPPVQSLPVSSHRLRSVSLHQPLTHLGLPEIFNHV